MGVHVYNNGLTDTPKKRSISKTGLIRNFAVYTEKRGVVIDGKKQSKVWKDPERCSAAVASNKYIIISWELKKKGGGKVKRNGDRFESQISPEELVVLTSRRSGVGGWDEGGNRETAREREKNATKFGVIKQGNGSFILTDGDSRVAAICKSMFARTGES